MGLDSPDEKMSKSIAVERPGHAVLLLDPPDARAPQDRARHHGHGARGARAGRPGSREPARDLRGAARDDRRSGAGEFQGKTYSVLKGAVADAIVDALAPIQARYAELRADEAGLRRILAESAARVCVVADATLQRVQEAVGLR